MLTSILIVSLYSVLSPLYFTLGYRLGKDWKHIRNN
jgi:hypothetical protein